MRAGAALATCAALLVSAGCGASDSDSQPSERIAYTASDDKSSSPSSGDTQSPEKQQPSFGRATCMFDGRKASVLVPSDWARGPSTNSSCSYSGPSNSRIVLSGDVPKGDPLTYLPVIEKTLRAGGMKDYERIRASRFRGDGMTWIYRHTSKNAGGGDVAMLVASVYHDGWSATYQSRVGSFDAAILRKIESGLRVGS